LELQIYPGSTWNSLMRAISNQKVSWNNFINAS
jgi:hypothetical protein